MQLKTNEEEEEREEEEREGRKPKGGEAALVKDRRPRANILAMGGLGGAASRGAGLGQLTSLVWVDGDEVRRRAATKG